MGFKAEGLGIRDGSPQLLWNIKLLFTWRHHLTTRSLGLRVANLQDFPKPEQNKLGTAVQRFGLRLCLQNMCKANPESMESNSGID